MNIKKLFIFLLLPTFIKVQADNNLTQYLTKLMIQAEKHEYIPFETKLYYFFKDVFCIKPPAINSPRKITEMHVDVTSKDESFKFDSETFKQGKNMIFKAAVEFTGKELKEITDQELKSVQRNQIVDKENLTYFLQDQFTQCVEKQNYKNNPDSRAYRCIMNIPQDKLITIYSEFKKELK